MTASLRRLPIESPSPVLAFALARVLLAAFAFALVLVLEVPERGELLLLTGAAGLPWTLVVLALTLRRPGAALNPLVALGDLALLSLYQLAVPDVYGATRFAALFLIAVNAHMQGERRGVATAVLATVVLVVPFALTGEGPVDGGLRAFWEGIFAASAVATGLLVGRLRTAESASRLRARSLTRRTLQAESEVRRRVAEAIHDGPVQELIGLDMVLSAARQAARAGDAERADSLLDDARELATRNVRVLRDEIVDLGPYAFEELTFAMAVENCIPIWKRRHGVEVHATLQDVPLTPDMAGDLFRIAQEAVTNAGRHAAAENVHISLRTVDADVELRVADDGKGFGGIDPLGASEPGHLGLASMRERAELLDGTLRIDSSERGTRVVLRAPLATPGGRG